MVWFFERDDEHIRIVTAFDNDTAEYLLRQEHVDGSEIAERFHHVEAFRERLHVLQRELAAERWTQAGPPVLLREGWPRSPMRQSRHPAARRRPPSDDDTSIH
jgi:hypothetical protein